MQALDFSTCTELTEIGFNAFEYCTNLTRAVFADTNGWSAGGYTSIPSADLANVGTAAKYLREKTDNGGYCDQKWKRN